jgi:hypothetical protein
MALTRRRRRAAQERSHDTQHVYSNPAHVVAAVKEFAITAFHLHAVVMAGRGGRGKRIRGPREGNEPGTGRQHTPSKPLATTLLLCSQLRWVRIRSNLLGGWLVSLRVSRSDCVWAWRVGGGWVGVRTSTSTKNQIVERHEHATLVT